MAEVGNLQARLSADVTDFIRGMTSAKQTSGEATRAIRVNIDELKGAQSIGNAFQSLGRGIDQSRAAAASAGQAFQTLGAGMSRVQGPAVASVAAGLQNVGAGLVRSTRASEAFGAGIATVGQGLRTVAPAAQLTASTVAQSASALLSIGGVTSPAASGLISVASAFGKLGAAIPGVAVVGGLAVAAFTQRIGQMREAAERAGKRIDEEFKRIAESIGRLEDRRISIETEAALAGLGEVERAVEAARIEFEATGISAGKLKSELEKIRDAKLEIVFQRIAEESQKAGAALQGSIREGVQDTLDSLANLKADIDIRPAAERMAELRRLAEELEFKGPITDVAALQAELSAAAEKVREIGKQSGVLAFDVDSEALNREIDEVQARIKERFKQEQEIKTNLTVDTGAAEAEVGRFLSNIDAIPAAELGLDFDVSKAIRTLDILRSRLVGTPEGELRVRLEAEISALEAKINAARQKEENDPIDIPVDADTSGAEADLDRLRAKAAEIGSSLVTGKGVQVFGEVASQAQVAAQQAEFLADVMDGLATASLPELLRMFNAGNQYLADFSDGLQLFGQNTTPVSQGVALLSQRIRELGGYVTGGTAILSSYQKALGGVAQAADAAAASVQQVGLASSKTTATVTPTASSEPTSASAPSSEPIRRTIFWEVKATGSPTLPVSEYFGQYLPRLIERSSEEMGRRAGVVIPTALDGLDDASFFGEDGDSIAALIREVRSLREDTRDLLERQNAITAGGARETRDVRDTLRGVPFAGHVAALSLEATRLTTGRRD